jgi:hypothetical protein
MRLIEIPGFAPDYTRRGQVRFYDGVTLSMYQRVQALRPAMLATAHRVLEAYFDRCGLPDPDSFPYVGALTGEFYWDSNEGYTLERRQVRVMLKARCLGIRPLHSEVPGDYCGVDVSLVFDPDTSEFEEFYTGHQVI